MLTPDPKAHVIADVFKIVNDPFVGKLSVFRVYQGTVRKDTQLFIDDGKKPFKVGHLFKLKGKDHVEIDAGHRRRHRRRRQDRRNPFRRGAARLATTRTRSISSRWSSRSRCSAWRSRRRPAARSRSWRPRCTSWPRRIPGFSVEHNTELNETVVRGLGELHLRVMLERMKERYGVEVKTRPPRIAYRETICGKAEGHHRHKKQTGGAGQFGEVFLRIEPLQRGTGFEFVDEVKGGTIPGQFLPAVEKGVRQVLHGGAVAGYPLQDVRVIVYDGKYHPVDSQGSRIRRGRQEGLPRRDREGAPAGAGADRRPRR